MFIALFAALLATAQAGIPTDKALLNYCMHTMIDCADALSSDVAQVKFIEMVCPAYAKLATCLEANYTYCGWAFCEVNKGAWDIIGLDRNAKNQREIKLNLNDSENTLSQIEQDLQAFVVSQVQLNCPTVSGRLDTLCSKNRPANPPPLPPAPPSVPIPPTPPSIIMADVETLPTTLCINAQLNCTMEAEYLLIGAYRTVQICTALQTLVTCLNNIKLICFDVICASGTNAWRLIGLNPIPEKNPAYLIGLMTKIVDECPLVRDDLTLYCNTTEPFISERPPREPPVVLPAMGMTITTYDGYRFQGIDPDDRDFGKKGLPYYFGGLRSKQLPSCTPEYSKDIIINRTSSSCYRMVDGYYEFTCLRRWIDEDSRWQRRLKVRYWHEPNCGRSQLPNLEPIWLAEYPAEGCIEFGVPKPFSIDCTTNNTGRRTTDATLAAFLTSYMVGTFTDTRQRPSFLIFS